MSPTIIPATYDDIPVLARIAGESFQTDRHTQLKALGKEPYHLENVFSGFLPNCIDSERSVLVKAVDAHGEIVGFCAWGFRGLGRDEVPLFEEKQRTVKEREILREQSSVDHKGVDETEVKKASPDLAEEAEDDPIKRLEALTNANMEEWMQKLMPEGTRCMYIISLIVASKYQRQGVGSALLRWGTEFADEKRLFIWVHSSEGGLALYLKAGFQQIGSLEVDLDEYASCPPPVEVGGEKWGHYIFTYMKYQPAESD